jgi:cysteinyl-tRNA synthetase
MSKSKNTGISITAEDCKKWIPYLDSLSIKKVNLVNPTFIKTERKLCVKPHMRSKRKILSYYYKRQNAKLHKNFLAADQIRDKLFQLGVKCRDRKRTLELYK